MADPLLDQHVGRLNMAKSGNNLERIRREKAKSIGPSENGRSLIGPTCWTPKYGEKRKQLRANPEGEGEVDWTERKR